MSRAAAVDASPQSQPETVDDQAGELAGGTMPPWSHGELPEPPTVKRGVLSTLGPGLMMAGAAIGGGEWLMGPAVTAQYGGVIRWLALASILNWLAYGIFAAAFVPLVFGGMIYKVMEKIMVAKVVLVLGYLLFLGLFYVAPRTWGEIFGGLLGLGPGPDGRWGFQFLPADTRTLDWALLGAFAAIAGQGGMNNSQFSSYVRDNGWGMGRHVGAIGSL